MHIIFESVLMLFTRNYQNQSMLVETTACQSWLVFKDSILLTVFNPYSAQCRSLVTRVLWYLQIPMLVG